MCYVEGMHEPVDLEERYCDHLKKYSVASYLLMLR